MSQALKPNYSNIFRLLPLGFLSYVLSCTIALSFLAPLPTAIAMRTLPSRERSMYLCFLVGLAIGSSYLFGSFVGVVIFIISLVLAHFVRVMHNSKMSYLFSIMALGSLILAGISLSSTWYVYKNKTSPKQVMSNYYDKIKPHFDEEIKKLKASPEDVNLEIMGLMQNKSLLIERVSKELVGVLITGAFFMVWLNLFLYNRFCRRAFADSVSFLGTYRLVNIRLPEWVIAIVIASLAGVLLSDYLPAWGLDASILFIKVLSVFFFFQGFGVYLYMLNHYKIFGFFRVFLIVLTVLSMGQYMIAIAGLLDMFFNLRRFFIHKGEPT